MRADREEIPPPGRYPVPAWLRRWRHYQPRLRVGSRTLTMQSSVAIVNWDGAVQATPSTKAARSILLGRTSAFRLRHPPRVHRDDPVVESVQPGLALTDDLRLEAPVADILQDT